jgi:hypothetical protein
MYLILLLTSKSSFENELEAKNLWIWGFEGFYNKKEELWFKLLKITQRSGGFHERAHKRSGNFLKVCLIGL